jgi:TetR/AcrR family transcriptional regulator, cholesterol catabolism regulator
MSRESELEVAPRGGNSTPVSQSHEISARSTVRITGPYSGTVLPIALRVNHKAAISVCDFGFSESVSVSNCPYVRSANDRCPQALESMSQSDGSSPSPNRGRYDDILSVFTRNVARDGYAGSNFSQIANELGISKGTIVHHYGTKDRLFAQMHDAYMERCLAQAHAIIARLPSPAERLAGLLFSFLLYQEVDRDATVAFQREIATLATHEALANGRRLRDTYLALVREILRDGVATGVFRPLDVHVQSLLIFGASHWAWTWFHPGQPLTALDAGAQLVQLALGSLLIDRTVLEQLADPGGAPALTAVQVLADPSLATYSDSEEDVS